MGRRFKPQTFGESDLSWLVAPSDEDVPDIDAGRSRYAFLSWDMEPGDVLVHDSMMVHGAGGDRSQTVRCRAVTTRRCGEDAYFRPSPVFDADPAHRWFRNTVAGGGARG